MADESFWWSDAFYTTEEMPRSRPGRCGQDVILLSTLEMKQAILSEISFETRTTKVQPVHGDADTNHAVKSSFLNKFSALQLHQNSSSLTKENDRVQLDNDCRLQTALR